LADLDIKNSKIHLPNMLGANLYFLGENFPKGNILFLKGNILSKIFLKKIIHKKNHKFISLKK
jgi:hypothetical protein